MNPNTKRLSKRKCEMWISNNKVLVGGNKKPHARNPNFETEETRLLISLWGDPKVQKTLITTHKKHPVIMKLADQMREHGYFRSADEINTRIKNLKCFYNRIKKDVEMGIITEPTWKHYAAMDEIVTRPVFGNRVQQPHLAHLQPQSSQHQQQPSSTVNPRIEVGSSGGGGGGGGSSDLDSTDGLRPEDLLSVKGDEDADVDFEGNAMVVPKDEPIDMDAEIAALDQNNDMEDVNDIFPKLSQYLQLAAAASAKGNKSNMLKLTASDVSLHKRGDRHASIIQIPSPPPSHLHSNYDGMPFEIKSSPPSSPDPSAHSPKAAPTTPTTSTTKANASSAAPPSPTAQLLSALALTPAAVVTAATANATTPTVASTLSTTTTTTATTMTTTSTHSKISLVPTNILMKPKVVQTAATSLQSTANTAAGTSAMVTIPVSGAGSSALPTGGHHHAATTGLAINPLQPQSISFGGEQYVCANTVSNGKSVYTSQQKDGQPMKVLLVNTIQKPVSQVTVPAGNMILANSSAASNLQSSQTNASAGGIAPPVHSTSATMLANAIATSMACPSSASLNASTSGITFHNNSTTITTIAGTSVPPPTSAPQPTSVITTSSAASAQSVAVSSAASVAAAAKTAAATVMSSVYATRSGRVHKIPYLGSSSSAAGSAAIASVVAEMENAAALKIAAQRRTVREAAAASAAVAAATSAGAMRTARRAVATSAAAASNVAGGYKTTRASQAAVGYRTLLHHLITLQNDTLETSRQRLQLEQQRLSFEQSMGSQLLAALQSLAGTHSSAKSDVGGASKAE